jgi:hypothetical protein
MTVPTRTTAIGMTTKIAPIVKYCGERPRKHRPIADARHKEQRAYWNWRHGHPDHDHDGRLPVSYAARKASLRGSAGQAKRWLRGGLYVGRLQLLLGGIMQEQLVS